MKYTSLVVIVLLICGCGNEQKNLQQQLDDEFGEYIEVVKPENAALYEAYNKTLKRWNIPFHELNIKTSFGNAHVIVSGPKDAEPLVLLHGLNASSTMWYPNIEALSENYRVYAIDYLLEPGKSEVIGKVKNMEEVIRWHNEIFDELKLEKFSLIGASKGGWLAVYLALQEPSRIKSMILLSPIQTFGYTSVSFDMLTNLTFAINPKRKNLRDVLKTLSADIDKIDQVFIEQYFIASEKADLCRFIVQMRPYEDEELKTLTMPVLTLIGDSDIMNNEESLDKANALLLDSETDIIKNAGHFLSIDQAETVNARMLDFLKAKGIKTL